MGAIRTFLVLRIAPVFLWVLAVGSTADAQHHDYRFTPTCKQAYVAAIQLRLDDALNLIHQAKVEDSANLMPVFLESYVEVLPRLLKPRENPSALDEIIERSKRRAKRLSRSPEGPWQAYCVGEIYFHIALLRFLNGDRISGVAAMGEAYNLLSESTVQYPQFAPPKKTLALIHAVAGSLPESVQRGLSIFGLKGSTTEALEEMRRLLALPETDFPCRRELELIYPYALLHLGKDKEQAVEFVRLNFPEKGWLLHAFLGSVLYSNAGKNDLAIASVRSRPLSPAYMRWPYLDYLEGELRLNALDIGVDDAFRRFVRDNGDGLYVAAAWLRRAWIAVLRENDEAYARAVDSMRLLPKSDLDVDREAALELLERPKPDPRLLRARLLCDGGYYDKALAELKGLSAADFAEPMHRIEFTYRVGRIFQHSGQEAKAIGFYLAALKDADLESRLYMPAKAALELGKIYEDLGQDDRAQAFYKKCLQFKQHPFAESFRSEAKQGLRRLS